MLALEHQPCKEGSRRSQDVEGRGGVDRPHLPVYDKHRGMLQWDPSTDERSGQTQRLTQSKTKRETSSHQQRHVLILRRADTRGAEGSIHLWAGDGTAIIIISFLLVSPFRLPPPPLPPGCSLPSLPHSLQDGSI